MQALQVIVDHLLKWQQIGGKKEKKNDTNLIGDVFVCVFLQPTKNVSGTFAHKKSFLSQMKLV